MSGMVNSAGGFLGLSSGPQAPTPQTYSAGMDQLNQMNNGAAQGSDILNQYANGSLTADQALQQGQDRWGGNDPYAAMGLQNALATGATTGSKYATEQVQNNPILGSLFGSGGQLQQQEGILNNLQNQGFNLTQGDNTLYGQEAGQIANQFGQQGNQAASDLANRGLSSSGAAGATFSGIAGNQNQMLANAQQQIAQQRFQNTQNQIQQQQSFINSLGAQAGNDINQQYGRQFSGAENQTGNEKTAGTMQTSANDQANKANMAAANFNVDNTPVNFMDAMTSGMSGAMSNPMGMLNGSNTSKQQKGSTNGGAGGSNAGYGASTTAMNPNAANGDWAAL